MLLQTTCEVLGPRSTVESPSSETRVPTARAAPTARRRQGTVSRLRTATGTNTGHRTCEKSMYTKVDAWLTLASSWFKDHHTARSTSCWTPNSSGIRASGRSAGRRTNLTVTAPATVSTAPAARLADMEKHIRPPNVGAPGSASDARPTYVPLKTVER